MSIWSFDSLTPGMALFTARVGGAVDNLMEEYAGRVEEYAKENAPWEDQSGAAREGLTANEAKAGPLKWIIVLYHSVDYGIWLEIRWNGRYAIIMPTVEHMGLELMDDLDGILGLHT